jgi:hypothetical protein
MQNIWKVCICPLGVILCFSVFFSVFLSSCSVHAVNSIEEQEIITVTGKIRVVGNEPFTHLVITADDGKDYLVQGDLEKELRALQYQRATVRGTHLKPAGEFKYRIDVKEYNIIDRAQ